METVLVFALLAIQFIALALFLVALPLFVGLMAWDLISDSRRPEGAPVEQIEARRSMAVSEAPRLSA
jgi:hypothetical protein